MMKYAKDRKVTSTHAAEVLIEAFPWIKNITGKNVILDDGYFEATFIRVPGSVSELNDMITSFLKGEANYQYVYTFRTKRLEIDADENIPWTLDGEYGGEHASVLIENWMQALDFIV